MLSIQNRLPIIEFIHCLDLIWAISFSNIQYSHTIRKSHVSSENFNYFLQIENKGCYKAPELVLGSKELSFAADIFSVGCIFGEMLRKKPLFRSKEAASDIFRYDSSAGIYTLLSC